MASAYIKDEQGSVLSLLKDEQGGTFIPASQRPDGTWRKPRRVKDGYVPQEEVPLYESKGKQFTKSQPTCPVGMSPEYVAAHKAKKEAQAAKSSPIPGLVIQSESKKRKKKNKSKSTAEGIIEGLARSKISETEGEQSRSTSNDKMHSADSGKQENCNQSQTQPDPAKRLKNLKKKLREIEALERKIANGEIKNPEKEMLEKVSRKAEVMREIKQLEGN